ncbi:uncharacterized membrane protein YccF (DUF307 family) [Prauserella shujinwangii]|uniref:Uncharacterized membrane protein YccF (DUF307 family) n=2 Tax=Prauserella shujinwangii TaxID=1453103 RepID=A0A2T0M0W2_9PSEU|nr:uncharacterized membrane protein YccF (DUF307 family) [Prauserella shujinwangii]
MKATSSALNAVKVAFTAGRREWRAVRLRWNDGAMRLLLNVIWLVLAGFWLAVGYAVAGIICCLLIVTIPFGIASFRIANYALWPFGRTLADRPGAGAPSLLGNIVWIVFAGWWLALEHVVTGVLLCLTVIGIPLGVANFKLVPVSLLPLGREIVPAPR